MYGISGILSISGLICDISVVLHCLWCIFIYHSSTVLDVLGFRVNVVLFLNEAKHFISNLLFHHLVTDFITLIQMAI